MTRRPSTWTRIRNRFRFGLATQEILDRLARLGLVIYPYFLVEEPVVTRPDADGMHGDLEVRILDRSDAHLVSSVPERPRDEAKVELTMEQASCVAVLGDGGLLGYSFFTRGRPTGMAGGVFPEGLPTGWAYLFDMYVRPVARGRGIAAFMRDRVHQMLAAEGVVHSLSITLMFNRSSRRFKAKLGAIERELRLIVQLKPLPGVDVRLWRGPWGVRTPLAFRASFGRGHESQ
jgi:GNAT superfamily N-acetyltransferase